MQPLCLLDPMPVRKVLAAGMTVTGGEDDVNRMNERERGKRQIDIEEDGTFGTWATKETMVTEHVTQGTVSQAAVHASSQVVGSVLHFAFIVFACFIAFLCRSDADFDLCCELATFSEGSHIVFFSRLATFIMSQDRGKDPVDSLTTARQGHNTKTFDSPFKVDPTVDGKRDDPVWHFVARGHYLDGSTAAGRKSGRRCLCRLCGHSICGGAKAAKEHFSKSEKFRCEAATPAMWNAIWSKDMTKCPKEFASAIETLQSHLPAPPSVPLAGTRGARDVGVGRSTPANEPLPLRDGVGSATFDEESTRAFIESCRWGGSAGSSAPALAPVFRSGRQSDAARGGTAVARGASPRSSSEYPWLPPPPSRAAQRPVVHRAHGTAHPDLSLHVVPAPVSDSSPTLVPTTTGGGRSAPQPPPVLTRTLDPLQRIRDLAVAQSAAPVSPGGLLDAGVLGGRATTGRCRGTYRQQAVTSYYSEPLERAWHLQIMRFIVESGMPFNSTKLESFKRMFTMIIPSGVPGAPAPTFPSYHMLRTTLLDELDGEVHKLEVPRAEKLVRCQWNLRLLDRPLLCDDGVGERPGVFGKWVHYWQAVEDEAAVDQLLVRGTGVLAKVTEEDLSLAKERIHAISHMGAERRVAESDRRRCRVGGRGRGGRGRAGVGGRTRGDAGSAPQTRRQRTDSGIRRARMRWDEGDFLFDSTSSDDDDFFASGTHASTGDDRGDADDRGDDRDDSDDRGFRITHPRSPAPVVGTEEETEFGGPGPLRQAQTRCTPAGAPVHSTGAGLEDGGARREPPPHTSDGGLEEGEVAPTPTCGKDGEDERPPMDHHVGLDCPPDSLPPTDELFTMDSALASLPDVSLLISPTLPVVAPPEPARRDDACRDRGFDEFGGDTILHPPESGTPAIFHVGAPWAMEQGLAEEAARNRRSGPHVAAQRSLEGSLEAAPGDFLAQGGYGSQLLSDGVSSVHPPEEGPQREPHRGRAETLEARPLGVIRSDGGEGMSEDTAQPGSADGGRSFRGGHRAQRVIDRSPQHCQAQHT
ncbi:hypothetical protein CBR_g32370 [Chara braunii]|uniref:Uncharacterized protein n=1 Tax=Chara braunii TaxID=69332 RepID=A0A388JY86_CHABU|nr:hypothetical protein CBR_g32370 [Chara braunii]|eukprot:GBG62781.1 hypothetical protein CBR_g32370 [Chara braunii]